MFAYVKVRCKAKRATALTNVDIPGFQLLHDITSLRRRQLCAEHMRAALRLGRQTKAKLFEMGGDGGVDV